MTGRSYDSCYLQHPGATRFCYIYNAPDSLGHPSPFKIDFGATGLNDFYLLFFDFHTQMRIFDTLTSQQSSYIDTSIFKDQLVLQMAEVANQTSATRPTDGATFLTTLYKKTFTTSWNSHTYSFEIYIKCGRKGNNFYVFVYMYGIQTHGNQVWVYINDSSMYYIKL